MTPKDKMATPLGAWRERGLITLVQTSPAIILAGMTGATALFFAATDGFFLETLVQWRNPYLPNYTGERIGLVVGGGFAGFLLGWFMSGAHIRLKAALLGVVLGMLIFLIIFDQGPLGWGTATLSAWGTFFVGLGYWARDVFSRLQEIPTTFGSAAWARFKELLAAGIITTGGFRLGFVLDVYGGLNPLSYISNRHLLTIAPNRSGKGTSIIVPNLLTYEGSVLVIDPKGENAMITARQRKAMGQNVFVYDPWGITGQDLSRFNPLDWLKLGDVDIGENSLLLSDALIMMESQNEPFFDHSAKATLDGLILHVATDKDEVGQRHLGRVRDLLMLDGDNFRNLCERMKTSPHHKVRSTGASLLQKDPKLLSNILASVQAQTNFLDSARVRESLSISDFDFADLKARPTTIYLVLPADRLEAYGRVLRLLVQQALTVNARAIEKRPEKPVLFLLDEMPALGKLTMLEQAFGLMAGFGIQIWGICQDLSQLKRIYGDGWETFISNAGMIQYFGSRDAMTAEYFSKLCGVTTVWDWSTALARAVGVSWGKERSHSETETVTQTVSAKQRKLAYPDELMRMHERKQLVFIENMNPIMAERRPWFEDDELKSLGVNLHLPATVGVDISTAAESSLGAIRTSDQ